MIRTISIKNFRSIKTQSIEIEEITTFVGNNDAGKSNVLRALNLFFNGETDHKQVFNFKSDFNINAIIHKQRAKEIIIELGLKLPITYRKDNYPHTLYWKKVWRENGEQNHLEEAKYCTLNNGRFTNKRDLPARSKIMSLLKSINFIYIPAIKDKSFFIELQGQIYDVLAQTTETDLHRSANDFEVKIQKEFNELLKDINTTFSNQNSISLPQNLRSIFENLEFNANSIPFTRRGDGIKVRHIPSMLRFIGKKSSTGKKTPITPQIWGFEEPENNIEYSACFSLNDQLVDAANEKIQIILTTHSPAIYNISNKVKENQKLKCACFFVEKSQDNSTYLIKINHQDIHEKIGFMPLIAPIIAEKEQIWKNDKKRLEETIFEIKSDLEIHKKHRVFVEGVSDKFILSKAIKIYAPDLIDKIHFDLKSNNSANAATDRAKAFHLIQKHDNEELKLKGFLILDNDEAGKKCRDEINEFIKNSNSKIIKARLLDKPAHITKLLKKQFLVTADLESHLPEVVWQHALNLRWLTEKPQLSDKFTQSKRDELFNNQKNSQEIIELEDNFSKLIINYYFCESGKKNVSTYINNLDLKYIQDNNILEGFKYIIEEMVTFFDSNKI